MPDEIESGENGNVNSASWWGFLGSDEEQVTVALRRVEKGSEPFLERFTISPKTMPSVEDMEEAVKERHGGGVYMVVFPGEGGRFAGRVKLEIAGLPKMQAAEKAEAPAGGLGEVVQLLLAQSEASEKRMTAVLDKLADKPQGPDAFAMFEKAATLLKDNGAAPQPQRGIIEVLREAKEAAELFGMGGQASNEPAWLELAQTFGPALLQLGQGSQVAPATPGAPAQKPDAQQQLIQRLRLLVASMVEMADLDVDPARALQKVQQRAGDHWPMLLETIQHENAVNNAAMLVPAVQEHAEWFEEVRAVALGQVVQIETETKPAPKKAPAKKARKAA